MSGLARVNIRPRFDFDSYAPVQGIVKDEEKEKGIAAAYHFCIHNAAAITVSIAGFWLINWWTHGGFGLTWWLFGKFAPGLLTLATTGSLGG